MFDLFPLHTRFQNARAIFAAFGNVWSTCEGWGGVEEASGSEW
jgi:hypothetical protein